MRMLSTIVLGALLVGAGCSAGAAPDPIRDAFPADVAAVQAAVNDIWVTIQQGDMARLASAHLDSPKFSKWTGGHAAPVGYAETVAGETEFFSQIADFTYEVIDLRVDVFGPAAVATFVIPFSCRQGEEPVTGRERATLVFVKQDGAWKIAHEHFSTAPAPGE